MTRALILSGGWGTRLRPLTCTIPKTLIPVGNMPVIERQMMLLKEAGVKEIVLAVSVMSEFLKAYFKEGEKLGLKIHYTDEKSPMGTAGALKLAEKFLEGDNFFMLNGDVILNFQFREMIETHKNYGGTGTIASKLVEDPSRYGVLIIDSSTNQILKFQEKESYVPPENENISMPINAGVYILEPEVFSNIPPNKKYSIERDVFPNLAKNLTLYHYPIAGIWKDIGKPYELLDGNILLMKDILNQKGNNVINLIDVSVDFDGVVKIHPPCTIGKNVVIRNNCTIGPNAIIGDNVYIGKNTEVKESLIYNETLVAKNCKIEKAIIADNCSIRNNVIIKGQDENLVILASYVEVLENKKLVVTNAPISFCHHEVVRLDI